MAIDLEIIVGLDGIEELVVDFGFGIAGIGGVVVEFGAELGVYLVAAAIGERLEDFGEEDVFIAEELKGFAIKGGRAAVPDAQKKHTGE